MLLFKLFCITGVQCSLSLSSKVNMAERPNPTSAPESSPLHERGGLTPEHWQFIKQKLPRKYKIKKFAKAILDGYY